MQPMCSPSNLVSIRTHSEEWVILHWREAAEDDDPVSIRTHSEEWVILRPHEDERVPIEVSIRTHSEEWVIRGPYRVVVPAVAVFQSAPTPRSG